MSLFKEKAYKLLSREYKSLYTTIRSQSYNAVTYGQKDDQARVVKTIVEQGNSLVSSTSERIIDLLEYLLDDDSPVK